MICILATLRVKEGKERLFEETFIGLTKEVRTNEEGNIFYQISRDREHPLTYIVMEHYIDQESVENHGKSNHFRAAGAKLAECLDGPPIIKKLEALS
jgi:quinol monooxygenase YgiN|tara:strand:+ start:371 stop:661 length:291 start_codon:yes stop_codon:yes gene_type:complete